MQQIIDFILNNKTEIGTIISGLLIRFVERKQMKKKYKKDINVK